MHVDCAINVVVFEYISLLVHKRCGGEKKAKKNSSQMNLITKLFLPETNKIKQKQHSKIKTTTQKQTSQNKFYKHLQHPKHIT